MIISRLPSSVRQTTRECGYLVMYGHYQSRDIDGSHTHTI